MQSVMTQWMSLIEPLPSNHPWIISLLLIILSVLAINQVLRIILVMLHKHLKKNQWRWDDHFFAALTRPLLLSVWVLGLLIGLRWFYLERELPLPEYIEQLQGVGLTVLMIWFVYRFVSLITDDFLSQPKQHSDKLDKASIEAIARLIRLGLLIMGMLLILQALGVSLSMVLAFGGVGGIAIGFAAKDLLSNLFGGIMIFLDRPFSTGDWITSPDRDIEGTVESIGWRMTRIRKFDKRPIYVPNSIFTTIIVENPSRMTYRRINETIPIRFEDLEVIDSIVEGIRQFLLDHPVITNEQSLIVNFTQFGSSSADILVNAFTRTIDGERYHHLRQEVLLGIHDVIATHGAEISYATSRVILQETKHGKRRPKSVL